jgi:hypothetical protein
MHIHPGGEEGCDWLECCERWCQHSDECEVPYRYMVVGKLQNPISRSIVKLIPPREIHGKEQLDALYAAFSEFCKTAWASETFPEKDPAIWEASGC